MLPLEPETDSSIWGGRLEGGSEMLEIWGISEVVVLEYQGTPVLCGLRADPH